MHSRITNHLWHDLRVSGAKKDEQGFWRSIFSRPLSALAMAIGLSLVGIGVAYFPWSPQALGMGTLQGYLGVLFVVASFFAALLALIGGVLRMARKRAPSEPR